MTVDDGVRTPVAKRFRHHIGDRVLLVSATREPGLLCEFRMVVEAVLSEEISLHLLTLPGADGLVRSVCGRGLWPLLEPRCRVARTAHSRRRRPWIGGADPLRTEPLMSQDCAKALLLAEGARSILAYRDMMALRAEREGPGGVLQIAWIRWAFGASWQISGWTSSDAL
jgi:hypothetical protein